MSSTDGMRGLRSVGRQLRGGLPVAVRGRPGVGGGYVVCVVVSLRRGVTITGSWAGVGHVCGYLAVAMRVRRGCFKE